MKSSGLITNNVPKLLEALTKLTKDEVLVGVPAQKTKRGEGITNAALAYIHDRGAPEANIPARPFMRPGIANAKSNIISAMRRGAIGVLQGDASRGDKALHSAGLAAANAIRARINEGIPPPLALSTIRARARSGTRGARGAREYRAFMDWPADMREAARSAGMGIAKPLVAGGELRNSITYEIRTRSSGKGSK